MKRGLLMALLAPPLAGCSTMHFTNGPRAEAYPYGEWHHGGIFDLVEFSDPVDLQARCEGDGWQSVKVEKSFTNGLADLVTYNLYDGWTVEYACSR
jgi:hypothetical protein